MKRIGKRNSRRTNDTCLAYSTWGIDPGRGRIVSRLETVAIGSSLHRDYPDDSGDEMTIQESTSAFIEHWPEIREKLSRFAFDVGFLQGREMPQLFCRVRRMRPKARRLWPRNYRARSRRAK